MLLRLDLDQPGALHERIAAVVRGAIADGQLAIGERLPAARDLAEGMGVNVNTVLRAYRDLREEGLIELRRGRGATVRRGSRDRARLGGLVDQLLAEGARLGMSAAEVATMVKERA